uniref:TBD domain-containing protein n=1 Tax=Mesocestoides corti TaxID=53468 RepID=A0A5K3EH95_MESCO
MSSGPQVDLSASRIFENMEQQLLVAKSENSRLNAQLTEMVKIHETEMAKERLETEKYRMRFERLTEDHSKLSKLNAELEEKLLTAVESLQTEKALLLDELNTLKKKFAEAEKRIKDLTVECETYKKDCRVAAELLHADPSQFLPINVGNSSSRPHLNSASSDDPLLPTPAHYLLPTTFPPIALYSSEPLNPPPRDNKGDLQLTVLKRNDPILEI